LVETTGFRLGLALLAVRFADVLDGRDADLTLAVFDPDLVFFLTVPPIMPLSLNLYFPINLIFPQPWMQECAINETAFE
jgi:hypothetical protein